MIDRAAVERLVSSVSRRYERPHAVVEAEQQFLADLGSLGATPVVERTAGRPAARRYLVGNVVIVGTVDVAGTRIALRVAPIQSPA